MYHRLGHRFGLHEVVFSQKIVLEQPQGRLVPFYGFGAPSLFPLLL